MRKLILVLLAFVTIAAGCHLGSPNSSTQYKTSSGVAINWQQNRPDTQVRYIELMVPAQFASDSQFMYAANFAVREANKSDYIHMVLDSPATIPTQCDPGWHCIVATRAPRNGGVAYLAWDSNGHMSGLRRIEFDSAPWTQAVLNNGFCHEVHHQLGLAHSPEGIQGPCQGGATAHDTGLVNEAHAHSDAVISNSTTYKTMARSLVVGHTRAEYERMLHASHRSVPEQILEAVTP